MARPDLATFIRQHAEPLVAAIGLEVWGIEVVGGGRPLVRLYVEGVAVPGAEPDTDSEGEGNQGVDIDQCAEISRRLGLTLEVEDPFADAWTLEVSSPGFDRQFFALSQCAPYIGREIEATLSAPLEGWPGRKKFKGVLSAVGEEDITLDLDLSQRRADEPESAVLPWAYIRRARLVYEFVEPEKPGKGKDSGKARAAEPETTPGKQAKKRGPKIHDELD